MRSLLSKINTPTFIRTVNAWFTALWLCLVIPTILLWRSSILWVAILSIWANVVSHYTAWLAARDEVRIERVEGNLHVHGDVTVDG